MKKLCLTLLCFQLLCGVGFATNSLVVGFGTAAGKTTLPKLPSNFSVLSSFEPDLSGTSWNVSYQKILDSGILWGGGYQNFEMSGSASDDFVFFRRGRIIPFQATLKTEQFRVSGIYGMIGYSFALTENLFCQPNFRLGIANNYEASYSFTVDTQISSTTATISGSASAAMRGLVLPFVYQAENLNIGGQLLFPTGSLTLAAGTGALEEEYKSELALSYQLVLGFNFSP